MKNKTMKNRPPRKINENIMSSQEATALLQVHVCVGQDMDIWKCKCVKPKLHAKRQPHDSAQNPHKTAVGLFCTNLLKLRLYIYPGAERSHKGL